MGAWSQEAAPGWIRTGIPMAGTFPNSLYCLARATSWGDIPPRPRDSPFALGGLPISDVQLSSGVKGQAFCLSQAIARRKKILPNPKGNGSSAGEEGEEGLVRKRRSKSRRKCSFRPWWLLEGGSWLSLMVLQVFTENGLKSCGLPKHVDCCVKYPIHFC